MVPSSVFCFHCLPMQNQFGAHLNYDSYTKPKNIMHTSCKYFVLLETVSGVVVPDFMQPSHGSCS